tara:strand:- start:24 stop:839 length:816 start_codon:yes stop_codon:yes gene_type:complete
MLSAISWLKMTITGQKLITSMLPDMETKKILDPYSTLIRLSVLYFKFDGTKLSILENKISYNDASLLQGTLRWNSGDNRNDLHNLHDPIKTVSEWYIESKNEDVKYLIKLAIRGLQKLKSAYQSSVSSSLVYHTLDHYINILMKALKKVKNNKNRNPFDDNSSNNNKLIDLDDLQTNVDNIDDIDNNILESSQIGDIKIVKEKEEIEIIKKKINTSFKNMWCENELSIHKNILDVAFNLKKNNKEYEHNINAINKLLDGKDKQIIDLLNKL